MLRKVYIFIFYAISCKHYDVAIATTFPSCCFIYFPPVCWTEHNINHMLAWFLCLTSRPTWVTLCWITASRSGIRLTVWRVFSFFLFFCFFHEDSGTQACSTSITHSLSFLFCASISGTFPATKTSAGSYKAGAAPLQSSSSPLSLIDAGSLHQPGLTLATRPAVFLASYH